MDDIKSRLKECSEGCQKGFEEWSNDKNPQTRENLQESIHELRKVASRLEIEIVMSDRAGSSAKPLPIPSHRSNSKSKGPVESILSDDSSGEGNFIDKSGSNNNNNNNGGAARRNRPRRPMPTKQRED